MALLKMELLGIGPFPKKRGRKRKHFSVVAEQKDLSQQSNENNQGLKSGDHENIHNVNTSKIGIKTEENPTLDGGNIKIPKKRGRKRKYPLANLIQPTSNHTPDGTVVKKKRGRKRKYPLPTVEPEEVAYKGSQHNNSVNDIVVKEKLLNDMNLGIDRNLPVEEIIGATIEVGFPAYLVTWEGSDEADLLPAEICKRKYPQPLIRFFEQHLVFPSENNASKQSSSQ
ncbi:uncharacterized protein LOC103507049 [Diaphorina citri]|uniref:Uncharacterized protein LOC103507049 n=1 Tax=Diaphorina citri TaxID=121845 RepID=A0A1S3CYL2_DIACI|nr:uncharacterized protein LOC103507049 [Diaphorina citri]XP_008469707.1 uncharacterized protein LOC103507049 [Diaphorina citri]XP_026677814.1 uncharacterized protein LOC103507049 [Diaphorina citri]